MKNYDEYQKNISDVVNFQMSYGQKSIKSTWVLSSIIVLVFLLEEYFGGSTITSVLVRMGANVKDLVAQGQYFRLMSSVFLHAGFMHVFFNTYVLFALGGFFNKILGESKYLTVFFISGIGGSLASFYMGKAAISVGASGAIWGLFGASIALAFFKTDLLPELVRLRLRKITLINLVINLGVSFLPMVDIWAHLGGGLAGFFVSLLIIFRSRSASVSKIKDRIFVASAFLLFAIYLLSLAWVVMSFTPWQDQLSSELTVRALASSGWQLSVPKTLQASYESDEDVYVFGDLAMDQLALEIRLMPLLSSKDENPLVWLKEQQRQILQDEKMGSDVKRSVDVREEGEKPHLFFKMEPKSEFAAYNYIFLKDEFVVKLVLVSSRKVAQSKIDDLAQKIIPTIKKKAP